MDASERWEELKRWLQARQAYAAQMSLTSAGEVAVAIREQVQVKMAELEQPEKVCGWCESFGIDNTRAYPRQGCIFGRFIIEKSPGSPVCPSGLFSDRRKGERRDMRWDRLCPSCSVDRRSHTDRRQS